MMNNDEEIQISDIEDYRAYLGNVNLKRKGVTIDWTEEMVQEFVKCAEDPIYFSQKYILIAEYFNRTPVMIEYQNQKDKMMKTHQDDKVKSETTLLLKIQEIEKKLQESKKVCDEKLISVYSFDHDPRDIFASHEMAGLCDGSLSTKMTVQFNDLLQ